MSTGAGIGTAISGLLAIDIFRYREDQARNEKYHLRMTRLFASLSIVCGTMFAMFIPEFGGMIPFYVAMTGTFFLPLTVPYVGGALYRNASRGAGIASLVGGTGLGCILFLGSSKLPVMLGHPQWRPFWVLGFAVASFLLWSCFENKVKGPPAEDRLANILNRFELGKAMTAAEIQRKLQSHTLPTWNEPGELDYKRLGVPESVPWYSHPTTYELTLALLLSILMVWWW
jgi:hypothetical protein